MRASEHIEAARHHEEMARAHSVWPATTAATPGSTDTAAGGAPWFRSWDTAAEQEHLAAEHRSNAAALEAEFQAACGSRTPEAMRTSPLMRDATGGWNTSQGVIVYLRPQPGGADALLADMRCHRAWLMLGPTTHADSCPLDLPGLAVDARGDANGAMLVLSVRNPALIPELQRRVAHQLEYTRSQQSEHKQ